MSHKQQDPKPSEVCGVMAKQGGVAPSVLWVTLLLLERADSFALSFIIIFTVISIPTMIAPSLRRDCSEKPCLAALPFFSGEVAKSI